MIDISPNMSVRDFPNEDLRSRKIEAVNAAVRAKAHCIIHLESYEESSLLGDYPGYS